MKICSNNVSFYPEYTDFNNILNSICKTFLKGFLDEFWIPDLGLSSPSAKLGLPRQSGEIGGKAPS